MVQKIGVLYTYYPKMLGASPNTKNKNKNKSKKLEKREWHGLSPQSDKLRAWPVGDR
jgi:hypothetical protein